MARSADNRLSPDFLVCWQPVVTSKRLSPAKSLLTTSCIFSNTNVYMYVYRDFYTKNTLVYIMKWYLTVILLPAHPASFTHKFVSGMQSFFYFSESQNAMVLQICHKNSFWTCKLTRFQLDPLIWETVSPRTHKHKFVNKVSILQCLVIIG